jgi:hypothetical protein
MHAAALAVLTNVIIANETSGLHSSMTQLNIGSNPLLAQGPRANSKGWSEFCDALGRTQVIGVDASKCSLGSQQVGQLIGNCSLRRVNVSGNKLFGAIKADLEETDKTTKVKTLRRQISEARAKRTKITHKKEAATEQEKRSLDNLMKLTILPLEKELRAIERDLKRPRVNADQADMIALWDAIHSQKSEVEDLGLSDVGIDESQLSKLGEFMSPALRKLDISSNRIGVVPLFFVHEKAKKFECRLSHLRDICFKEQNGAIIISRETGTCWMAHRASNKNMHGDSHGFLKLVNFETEEEEEVKIQMLQDTADAYRPQAVDIGQCVVLETFWNSMKLLAVNLEALDLSSCELDTDSVLSVASMLAGLAQLKELTMTATALGPWRGVNGLQFKDKAYETADDYKYTLKVSEVGELDISHSNLGPEDAVLVSAWLKQIPVSSTLTKLVLSYNRLFGNFQKQEDGGGLARHETGGSQGREYRVFKKTTVRAEPSRASKEVGKLRRGDVILVDVIEPAGKEFTRVMERADPAEVYPELNGGWACNECGSSTGHMYHDSTTGAYDLCERCYQASMAEPTLHAYIGEANDEARKEKQISARMRLHFKGGWVSDTATTTGFVQVRRVRTTQVRTAPCWPRSWANFSLL